jgi:hypothetical protein
MTFIKSMTIHGQLNAMAVGMFLPLLGFSLVKGSAIWAAFDAFRNSDQYLCVVALINSTGGDMNWEMLAVIITAALGNLVISVAAYHGGKEAERWNRRKE